LYVDSTGKVIETKNKVEATAGNDLYLSIDKDLQEAVYKLLEQKLAGILLEKITNTYNFEATGENDIIIGIDDVYNAFFENNILDITHFSEDDAQDTEKAVYKLYVKRQSKVIDEITDELTSSNPSAYGDLDKEMRAYMYYIYDTVLTSQTGILLEDSIDSDNEMYQKLMTDRTISMKEFLTYAISQNWIDTAKLQQYISTDETYTDSSQIYDGLVSFLQEYLSDSTGFGKLIYKYMIKSKKISGNQVCLLLFEQGVLKEDKDAIASLKSGGSAYEFIRNKINNLEITPAQLALEPCSASTVITDTNTGKVLALVSYPGYDNNRLANSMDSDYYSQLLNDGSTPLFNKATQEATAPGSTFKMVSAVTALTTGIINANTYFTCTGVFSKIEPSSKCWIYPGAHGSLNVVGAIQHSCNNFFYEIGYELGLENEKVTQSNGTVTTEKVYSSEKGLATLSKYAEAFGLGTKTGLEITESTSQISDNSSVHSAIGQGTNNYTTANLARYVAAVANEGTAYNLSLVDSVKDKNGETVEEFEPEVYNTLDEVSDSTWSLVKEGMRDMVKAASQFSDLNSSGFALAGKTGTAQQSTKHPDHALFVGFAPYDDPEISIAVRITNGYKSAYASEVAQDIIEYEFQIRDTKDLITGKAKGSTSTSTSGD
jgi:penicillin-binding protein 2